MNYKIFGFYILFWLILAQTFNIERILIGILICIVVFVFNKDFLNIYKKNYSLSISNLKYSLLYITVLIKEIIKSNFHVAKIVLSPKLDISTTIVTIDTKLKSDFNKTILANSITLTPGTLTLDMTEDKLIIHCLDMKTAKALQHSSFENILLKKEALYND